MPEVPVGSIVDVTTNEDLVLSMASDQTAEVGDRFYVLNSLNEPLEEITVVRIDPESGVIARFFQPPVSDEVLRKASRDTDTAGDATNRAGSAAGAAVGAYIGTIAFPGVGTILGSAVGLVIGNMLTPKKQPPRIAVGMKISYAGADKPLRAPIEPD